MIFFNCKQKVNFTLVGGVRVYDLGRIHMSDTTFQWKNGAAGSNARQTRRERSAQVSTALKSSFITKEAVTSAQNQVSIIEANKELLSNIRENRSHITSNNEKFVDEDNSLLNSLDENEKQLLKMSNQQQNVRLQEIQGKTAGIEEAMVTARKAGTNIDYNIIFKRLYSNQTNSNEGNARIALTDLVEKKAKKFGFRNNKSVRTLILDDKKKLSNKLRGISHIERADKETQNLVKGKSVDVAKFGSYKDANKADRKLIEELTGRKPSEKKTTRKSTNYSETREFDLAER